MREFLKKIMIWKLDFLAKIYLRRYKPAIVAVTGNVGKTSTKETMATVLGSTFNIRAGKGNLNNEFGVPLTILGDWAEDYYETGNSVFFWIKVLAVSFFKLFYPQNYPEILVLEYGADKPGDIRKLCHEYKPHISVVTAIGEIPVHVEFFQSPEHLAKEKSEIVKCLDSHDYAVLNFDDQVVLDMKEKTKAHVHTFGFQEGAFLRLSNFDLRSDDNGKPLGVSFKLNTGEHTFVPVKINGTLGKSQAYASGVAAAVGLIMKMNLVDISVALANYHGLKGRLKLIPGIKNTTIIDDTYNASPASTHLALETLKNFSGHKVAVIGDMLELGEYTEQAHRVVGDFAAPFVDILVCVGLRAKFVADSAANQMDSNDIYTFDTSEDAKLKVQELIQEGDTVLVKGSQGMRMEKIVEEIMAEPLKKKELLVRQGLSWQRK